MEKRPFFRAAMAGLGKYCTGGYGRIGVCRDKFENLIIKLVLVALKWPFDHCHDIYVSVPVLVTPKPMIACALS